MVVTDPRVNERRRTKEATIRIIDLVVYAFVVGGGIFALAVPPQTVQDQLGGFPWIASAWGGMLILAGLLGFLGRLTRLWIIEVPGTTMAIAGELVYVIVLGATAFTSATVWVAICMLVGAMLALARRYTELQIFTTDPGEKSFSERLAASLRRRTANTVGEHR